MRTVTDQVDVAIVGGGLAGLTTAYRLAMSAPHLSVALFEASDRFGGKIASERMRLPDGDVLIESGADAYLASKPWATELITELGLAGQLQPIQRLPRPVALLKHGRPIDLPAGVALIAPSRFGPFLRSPLISPRGKARMLAERFVPMRDSEADESLGAFVRRRFGQEALDWIAEPLAAGIYNADPDRLSLLASYPRLRTLERSGGVLRGLRATAPRPGQPPPPPVFLTLGDGMEMLVTRLAEITGERAQLNTPVTAIERLSDGRYRLAVHGSLPISAQTLVLALPAAAAATFMERIAPEAATIAGGLRAVGAGAISMVVPERAITRPLPGYGLVIPHREGQPFNALTVSSRKFAGRAPAGWSLLRLFSGGFRSPATLELDDDALTALALDQLRDLIGLTGSPAFTRIGRWTAGSPQYDVGHLDRMAALESALPPGLHLTGSPYYGVGIPDIVHAATELAAGIVARQPSLAVQHEKEYSS